MWGLIYKYELILKSYSDKPTLPNAWEHNLNKCSLDSTLSYTNSLQIDHGRNQIKKKKPG